MTILVGIQRNFIDRTEAVRRMNISLNFLANANRFHGAWSHWINGNTGNVIPFGPKDNGGDIVETAYLCQGLLTVREYFYNSSIPAEVALANLSDYLWRGVDWTWYLNNGNSLWWNWSPNYGFFSMQVSGENEAMITYILAASSPTFPIAKSAYINGWTRNGAIVNKYGTRFGIPLIFNYGSSTSAGPLFFSTILILG